MRLIKNIICLTVLMVFTLFHTQISFAADSEWYWISSDDKYSKYFSMTRITTVSSQNNIPTCIEDWIKTGYAPGGAAETIANMKLPINDPNQLVHSIEFFIKRLRVDIFIYRIIIFECIKSLAIFIIEDFFHVA